MRHGRLSSPPSRLTRLLAMFPALLPIGLSACSDLPALARPMGAHEIVITATDFSFRAPEKIPAGLARIRLFNEGRERHHAQLVRLPAGRTITELRDSLTAGTDLPAWVTYVGGPNVPPPGAASEILVRLEPGSYAIVCFISSSDGAAHLAKGMLREISVISAPELNQPEPRADVLLRLDDFGFALTPTLAAGRRTIRVENSGPQPHEVVFVRLASGKTAADVLAWLKRREGPPPGETFGGAMALQPGQVNFVTAEFPGGEYALFCFVPDSTDGKPHVAHGMVRQVRVE